MKVLTPCLETFTYSAFANMRVDSTIRNLIFTNLECFGYPTITVVKLSGDGSIEIKPFVAIGKELVCLVESNLMYCLRNTTGIHTYGKKLAVLHGDSHYYTSISLWDGDSERGNV